MATLHQHVGGHHGPAVGHGYERGVVTWTDDDLGGLGTAGGQAPDHRELAELRQGLPGFGAAHGGGV